MLSLQGMVKKLLLVSLIILVSDLSSGCISLMNLYRSHISYKRWEDLAHKRQYDKAEETLTKAIEFNSKNVKAWIALGDIYLMTDGYREARFAYEEALRLDENAFEAHPGLWAIELEESGYAGGVKEKVKNEVETFNNTGDKSPEKLMAVFNGLNYLHEYDKAATIAKEIMELSPDEETSSTLSTYIFEELLREKDTEKRLKMIDHYLRTFPSGKESYIVNHLRLSIVQKELKNRELLFQLGEEWIQKEPENRRANFSAGYWYTEEGIALESAVSYIGKALRLIDDPDPADKPEHYPETEWMKDLQKTKGTYYATSGLAYYKLGQRENAEAAYNMATQYLEYDKDLYYRTGILMEEKGNTAGAINAYVQALKSGENKEAEERLKKIPLNPPFSKGETRFPPLESDTIYKYFAKKEGITSFSDVTEAAGLNGVSAGRVAWGDYNNDTYEDILLDGHILFRNNKDGTFTNITNDAGITYSPGANGGIWGDIDNDGFIDFYTFATGTGNTDRIWKNNRNDTFTDITDTAFKEPDTYPTEAAAWGDYDNDGFIDLYLANYEKPLLETIDRGRCNPDHLFHNNGDGTFTEVSKTAGTSLRENMCGRGVSWGDYDNDGDSDIYVSNYRLDPNLLWKNNGDGRFTNASDESGVEGYETEGAYGHSIGSEWGDYNNDGDLDLFVSNLAHPRYIGYSDKSMLLENQGPPHFTFKDRYGDSGIRFEETSADPSFADYDNDGFLDLYFTSTYEGRKSFLYKGNGNGKFTDITWLAGVRVDDGWGNAFADYDNDGDLDLAVGGGEGLRLFRNDGNENHWLHIRVAGNGSNRSGIGARVIIAPTKPESAFQKQIREVQGGKGSGSQHSLPVEFGLGNYSGPIDVEVRFPSGKIAKLNRVTPDQLIVVDEQTAN